MTGRQVIIFFIILHGGLPSTTQLTPSHTAFAIAAFGELLITFEAL
jgi:hypothetical protein